MENIYKNKVVLTALGMATATCITVSGILVDTKIKDAKINKQLTNSLCESKKIQDNLKEELNIFTQEKKIVIDQLNKLKEENENLKGNSIYPIEKVYFDENDITKKSNAKARNLNSLISETGLSGLGEYYIQAEKKYNINAIALLSITAQESGWGNSDRAMKTNNLSGYAVYSPSSAGVSFKSKGESIMATAKLLYEDYLNPKGKYYQGKDLYVINETYCPDDDYHWSNNITKIGKDIEQKINSLI